MIGSLILCTLLLITHGLLATGVYLLLHRYCRNAHHTHVYEEETDVFPTPPTGTERRTASLTAVSNKRIRDDNVRAHRKRLPRALE